MFVIVFIFVRWVSSLLSLMIYSFRVSEWFRMGIEHPLPEVPLETWNNWLIFLRPFSLSLPFYSLSFSLPAFLSISPSATLFLNFPSIFRFHYSNIVFVESESELLLLLSWRMHSFSIMKIHCQECCTHFHHHQKYIPLHWNFFLIENVLCKYKSLAYWNQLGEKLNWICK